MKTVKHFLDFQTVKHFLDFQSESFRVLSKNQFMKWRENLKEIIPTCLARPWIRPCNSSLSSFLFSTGKVILLIDNKNKQNKNCDKEKSYNHESNNIQHGKISPDSELLGFSSLLYVLLLPQTVNAHKKGLFFITVTQITWFDTLGVKLRWVFNTV